LTAAERASREIRQAALRASDAEQELERLGDEMLAAGVSPDLDCQEAVAETATRLRQLSESLH
jgi:hypothetical protein